MRQSLAAYAAVALLTGMTTLPAAAASAPTAATVAFEKANMAMHHGMMIQYTGNTDIDFVRGMIPHHQGAIEMAKILLAHGKDPELQKLGHSIIAAQTKEIAEMQAWLAIHDKAAVQKTSQ
jgi:uncharacterized protein (DUF305 family)